MRRNKSYKEGLEHRFSTNNDSEHGHVDVDVGVDEYVI
jgi:hypothetical protein